MDRRRQRPATCLLPRNRSSCPVGVLRPVFRIFKAPQRRFSHRPPSESPWARQGPVLAICHPHQARAFRTRLGGLPNWLKNARENHRLVGLSRRSLQSGQDSETAERMDILVQEPRFRRSRLRRPTIRAFAGRQPQERLRRMRVRQRLQLYAIENVATQLVEGVLSRQLCSENRARAGGSDRARKQGAR